MSGSDNTSSGVFEKDVRAGPYTVHLSFTEIDSNLNRLTGKGVSKRRPAILGPKIFMDTFTPDNGTVLTDEEVEMIGGIL